MTRLHVNACLVSLEVWELLAAGYAQGAFTCWRSLHETAVTALFIHEHGEDVALRYWMHGAIERRRLLREHDDAGLEPLDPQVLDEIGADRASAVSRWGPEFAEAYGWAAEVLDKKRPSFRDIEQSLDVIPKDTRWTYKWASTFVHPQIWGVTVSLGLPSQERGLLVGPSIIGLDWPGHAALLSLSHCTVALGTLLLEPEWQIRLRVWNRLTEEASSAFKEAGAGISSD